MATETKAGNKSGGLGGGNRVAKTKFDSSSVIKNSRFVGGGTSSSKHQSSVDSKHKFTSTTKTEAKGKSVLTTKKQTTTTTTTTVKKREKKVYSLPGQKFDVPEEREPLRIFYESLSKQIPSSEMAEFWLMEHGMLSPEKAKKAYEKKQRRQKEIRNGTPIKSLLPSRGESSKKPQQSLPPSRGESSKKPQFSPLGRGESLKKPQSLLKNGVAKPQKPVMSDSDDDDFVLSHKRRKG